MPMAEDDEVVGVRDDVCAECFAAAGETPMLQRTGSCGCSASNRLTTPPSGVAGVCYLWPLRATFHRYPALSARALGSSV